MNGAYATLTESGMPVYSRNDRAVFLQSILQPTQPTAMQMLAQVDLFFRNGLRKIEILLADDLQLPNAPLFLFIKTIEDFLKEKAHTIDQFNQAREEFVKNIELVRQHITGIQQLIKIAEDLTIENLEEICRKNKILPNDSHLLKPFRDETEKLKLEWRNLLTGRFGESVVEEFISFVSWSFYQGNPWGNKISKERFISHLKYLKIVYHVFNQEDKKDYNDKITMHAGEISLARYKEMTVTLSNFFRSLGYADARMITPDNSSDYSVSIGTIYQSTKTLGQSIRRNHQTPTAIMSEVKGGLEMYAQLIGYKIETAIEFSIFYLLSEFAVFNNMHVLCEKALRDGTPTIKAIAYHGPMTDAVSAHYTKPHFIGDEKTEQSLGVIQSSSTHCLSWLNMQYPASCSKTLSKKQIGDSRKDEQLDSQLLEEAKKAKDTKEKQKAKVVPDLSSMFASVKCVEPAKMSTEDMEHFLSLARLAASAAGPFGPEATGYAVALTIQFLLKEQKKTPVYPVEGFYRNRPRARSDSTSDWQPTLVDRQPTLVSLQPTLRRTTSFS